MKNSLAISAGNPDWNGVCGGILGAVFRQHPDISAEGDRLEKLSCVVSGKIRKILG